MKPPVTNHKHQQFILLLEDNIQKMEEIPKEEKIQIVEKIKELKNNKQVLQDVFVKSQFKLKELSELLDEYEKVQQISRINIRKMQLWLKSTPSKLPESMG